MILFNSALWMYVLIWFYSCSNKIVKCHCLFICQHVCCCSNKIVYIPAFLVFFLQDCLFASSMSAEFSVKILHRYVNFHSLPSVFTQPDFYTVQRHFKFIVNLVKADHSKSFLPWKRLHVVSFCPGSCWVILKPGSCLFKTSFFGAPPSQCTHSATKIYPLFLCFFIYSKRLLIRQMRW